MSVLKPGISVVIPVYYAESTLAALTEQLEPVLANLVKSFEIILVNDGSGDQSWELIKELAAASSKIFGINLVRNFGQHNALLCGIRAAQYETIVTMDDDLQHPPEGIPLLLNELEKGNDLVYGSPVDETHGIVRDFASILTKTALSTVMNAKSSRHVSAFRVFRTGLREAFANYNGDSVSLDVLLSWATRNISYVEVQFNKRETGKSNYTFSKLLKHAFNLITGFTTIPLRIATGIGFIFILFGLGILLYVGVRFLLFGGVVPGFTFLTSIIVVFSGVQLFSLGIFGEYLSRMHNRLMDKPSYVIKSKTW